MVKSTSVSITVGLPKFDPTLVNKTSPFFGLALFEILLYSSTVINFDSLRSK